MVNSQLYKLAIGILGTVILGAIGSGLWDAVLKPAFPKLADFMLTISTLGLQEMRDSIYVEIARGNYERASLGTFEMASGMFSGITVGMIVGVYVINRKSYIDNTDAQNLKKLMISSKKIAIPALLIQSLFAGFIIFNATRMTYIVIAAGQLQQMQDIVAPFLSDDERIRLHSNVAQIRSREDFQNITDQMSKIAGKNGLSVPRLNIF
jgi:hypothetical protein